MTWRSLALSALTTTTLFATVVHAEPASSNEAERLFSKGRELLVEGRLEEACRLLAASQALEPSTGTLLNLAVCHERRGQLALARQEYEQARDAASNEGDADRTRLANGRLAEIEPRLAHVSLIVGTTWRNARVTMDDAPVDMTSGTVTLPVDPGSHAVRVEIDGRTVRLVRFEARPTTTETLLLAPGKEEALPSVPTEAKAATPTPDRWVFEPGVYIAFASGSIDSPQPKGGDGAIALGGSGSASATCADVPCTFGPTSVVGSASLGLSAFVGYAATRTTRLGVRGIAGPVLSGGWLAAAGPAVSFLVTPSLSLGAWAAIGDAKLSGYAPVIPPKGYAQRSSGSDPEVYGSPAPGVGAGVELSISLARFAESRLLATTTPLFLVGSQGTAFVFPVGLAFRL